MAISYPLTPPSNPKPSTLKWVEVNTNAVSQSRYSGQQQIFDWASTYWKLEVTIDPVYRDEAAEWISFLSALRGQAGTFMFGDVVAAAPRGSAGGSPKVNGAGQYGFELASDGWSGANPILKKGDFFQINNNLYRCLADVSHSGGAATIDCWPRLKQHADNTDIIVSSPKGIFRLEESENATHFTDRNQLIPINFSAVEAL